MLTVTLLAAMLAAPVPKDAAPPGPAPRILELKVEPDGKVRVMVVRQVKRTVTVNRMVNKNGQNVIEPQQQEVISTMSQNVELSDVKDLTIYKADGKEADKPVAMKKLLEGGLVVVSADGKKVDPKFLKLFRDDVLVLASPELLDRSVSTLSRTVAGVAGGNVIINGGAIQVMPAQAVPALPPVIGPPPIAVQAEAKVEAVPVEKKAEEKKEEKKKD